MDENALLGKVNFPLTSRESGCGQSERRSRSFNCARYRFGRKRPALSRESAGFRSEPLETVRELCTNPTFSIHSSYLWSEKQIPRFVGTLVVRRNGRSCWSRMACAQERRASRNNRTAGHMKDSSSLNTLSQSARLKSIRLIDCRPWVLDSDL